MDLLQPRESLSEFPSGEHWEWQNPQHWAYHWETRSVTDWGVQMEIQMGLLTEPMRDRLSVILTAHHLAKRWGQMTAKQTA